MKPAEYWLITDTHFNHQIVIDKGGRPENHGELMIKWMRHFLKPNDVLIHLGDVIFKRPGDLAGLLWSVPTHSKILIRGNHDKQPNNWYLKRGFSLVCDKLVVDDILLTHKPQRVLPDGVRINIHGHFHNTDHRKYDPEFNGFLDPKIHRLLAMEHTEYKPVKLHEFAK